MVKRLVFIGLIIALLLAAACTGRPGSAIEPGVTAEPAATAFAAPTTAATNQDNRFDCATVSEIPAAECQALLAFYEATNGPAWANNDPAGESASSAWLATNTPCSWPGVTCVGGHVDTLALFFNELQGELPATLADLTHLRVLDLHNNALRGPIPPEIGRLANLESLDLSVNQLSGPIPAALGDLNKLRWLHLPHNELSGPLPAELGQIASLEYLDLAHNQLSAPLPASLADLTALGALRVNSNQLEGSIPAGLGQMPALHELDLSFNRLSGPLPAGISQVWLHRLWGNQLDGAIITGAAEQQTVSYQGASFTYPGSLAASVWPERMPALPAEPGPGGPWASPEHLSFTLVGPDGPQRHMPLGLWLPAEAQVHLYPTAGLNEESRLVVAALAALLAERTAPADAALPVLPPTNAQQVLRAQVAYLDFHNGSGVRFLTQYAQGFGPVNNEELFYTFQGLTSDGATYVAAFFPVRLSTLPDSAQMAPEEFEAFMAQWDGYLPATTELLNGQPAAAFQPDLAQLDSLITSLTVP
jgi:hypothetical protein